MTTKIPASLVISGLVKSRFKNESSLLEIKKSLSKFKQLNPKNEIIFSTYEGEIPDCLGELINIIIINKDPGEDKYKSNPWPVNKIGKSSNNISRILQTNKNGIAAASNEIVFKTRIELIPEQFILFEKWFDKICNDIYNSNLPKIALLTEHFSGISFSIDGVVGGIPDTLQIARREVLLNLWTASDNFWQTCFVKITTKKIFPLTSEQVLGFSFLKLFCGFNLDNKIDKLHKYYFSHELLVSQIYAEKKLYLLCDYKLAGLTRNYFSGTYFINTNRKFNLENKSQLVLSIFYLLLKQIKHIVRKFYKGFKIALFKKKIISR
jgi:hypothetical protein